MKKIILIILSLCIFLTSVSAIQAQNSIKVYVNGQELVFDAPPVVVNGKTMVPARPLAEALGATVVWYDKTQVISIQSDVGIDLQVGSKKATCSWGTIELDVAPFFKDKRLYAPLRFISECMSKNVSVNSADNSIHITDMVQDGWYIDTMNNYKIKMFKNMEFYQRLFVKDNGKIQYYEASVTPFERTDEWSLPTKALRMSWRITPEKGNMASVLESLITAEEGMLNLRIEEKTANTYLIAYEKSEGGWDDGHRYVLRFIKYNDTSILMSEFDAVDFYYNQYKDEIIENLKSIQALK